MSNLRVETVYNEEDADLGIVQLCVFDGEEPAGKIELTDKRAVIENRKGNKDDFSPYITFIGIEVPGGDQAKVKDVADAVFAFLQEHGVKEVSYNASNKNKDEYLKGIGFELVEENNEGYYTVFVYQRVLAKSETTLSSLVSQHGKDSSWEKF